MVCRRNFLKKYFKQANETPDTIDESEIQNRRDLRNEMIVTIDGADAKDLDDAVTVTKLENGNYKLGVHIADVSYYVTEESPIDREASRSRDECLFSRPGYSDDSTSIIKWNLLFKSKGGSFDAFL